MKIAIPVIDIHSQKRILASGLNVNGSLCLYDSACMQGTWLKTTDLAENMGDLLPALEQNEIKALITDKIHPMALKILVNKGFLVFQSVSSDLDENIGYFINNQLAVYSAEAAMSLATVCGGECSDCSSDECSTEKKEKY